MDHSLDTLAGAILGIKAAHELKEFLKGLLTEKEVRNLRAVSKSFGCSRNRYPSMKSRESSAWALRRLPAAPRSCQKEGSNQYNKLI
jgi:uncharacterized protein YerC